MKKKRKSLNIDLSFLDDKDSLKTKQANSITSNKELDSNKRESNSSKTKWMNILIFSIMGLFFIFLIISNISSDNNKSENYFANEAYYDIDIPVTLNTENKADDIDIILDPKTEDKADDIDIPIIPKTKSNKEICIDNFGVYSYPTGGTNVNGGPICDCSSGYKWNDLQTACVIIPVVPKTNDQICKDVYGNKSHYSGKKGDNGGPICDCISGYDWNTARTSCIDLTVARDQSCAKSYPGTSFLEYSEDGKTNICACKSGYYWNNDRTACYTIDALNNSCINAYGTGSYSYIQSNERVCGCEYSYDWNIDRTSCVTTNSIDVICERDVGRNSVYAGYVEDGVYICTDPY